MEAPPPELQVFEDFSYEPTPVVQEWDDWFKNWCEQHREEIEKDYEKYGLIIPDFGV